MGPACRTVGALHRAGDPASGSFGPFLRRDLHERTGAPIDPGERGSAEPAGGAFLLLVVAGLFSRLTPVRVDGVDCADPPAHLTSECFDAEGDRSELQIAVSGTVLVATFLGVKAIGRCADEEPAVAPA